MLQNNDEAVEYTLTITSTEEHRIKAALAAPDLVRVIGEIKDYLKGRDEYIEDDLQSIGKIREDILGIISDRVTLHQLEY